MLEGLLGPVHVECIDLEILGMISVCVSSICNKVTMTVDFSAFSYPQITECLKPYGKLVENVLSERACL